MSSCKHDEGAKHNCHYVDERNRLIPKAMLIADSKVMEQPGERPGDETILQLRSKWAWSRYFLEAMDQLYHGRNLS